MTFFILDIVISEIEETIGGGAPERGGALLGPPSVNLITKFLYDAAGTVTTTSYVPSAGLTKGVQAVEATSGLSLKGIIHSHPGSLSSLSAQDKQAFARALAANRHLAVLLAPIVTFEQTEGALDSWRLRRGGMLLSFYSARRPRIDAAMSADISPCDVVVIPLWKDSVNVASRLGLPAPQMLGPLAMKGHTFHGVLFTTDDDTELIVYIDERYPLTRPLFLLTRSEKTREVSPAWCGIGETDQLIRAVRSLLEPS